MRLRPVPEGQNASRSAGPGSGRPVVTRDHDQDDRTAAISLRCGRGAAGARPHRPRAKQARTPRAPPAFFRHAAFGWRPRWSRRRTGDRFRRPAQAGRGRDRTSRAPSTPPLAADRASPAERGWRRRRRSSRPSRVGRGPPNLRLRVGRPRRDAAPLRWRDRSRRRAAHVRNSAGGPPETSNSYDRGRDRLSPTPPSGRVGDWRAGLGRSSRSLLARSFVCECHTISTMPRFQPPPRRTQRADFPHYAPPFASCQGLWDLSCWGDFRLCLIHRSQPRPFCS